MQPKDETSNNKKSTKGRRKDKSKSSESAVHKDENFEQTLLDLDDELLCENVDLLEKSMEISEKQVEAQPKSEEKKKRDRKPSENGRKFPVQFYFILFIYFRRYSKQTNETGAH